MGLRASVASQSRDTESSLVCRRIALIALMVALLCAGVAAYGQMVPPWGVATNLYSHSPDGTPINTSSYLQLTPSYELLPSGLYYYTYDLRNFTPGDYIDHFAITFPNATFIYTPEVTSPSYWEMVPHTFNYETKPGSYLEFVWRNAAVLDVDYALATIAPGETETFGFQCFLGPSDLALVTSATNGHGFSGITYGPLQTQTGSTTVPDAPTWILGITGMASLGMLKLRGLKRR